MSRRFSVRRAFVLVIGACSAAIIARGEALSSPREHLPLTDYAAFASVEPMPPVQRAESVESGVGFSGVVTEGDTYSTQIDVSYTCSSGRVYVHMTNPEAQPGAVRSGGF